MIADTGLHQSGGTLDGGRDQGHNQPIPYLETPVQTALSRICQRRSGQTPPGYRFKREEGEQDGTLGKKVHAHQRSDQQDCQRYESMLQDLHWRQTAHH